MAGQPAAGAVLGLGALAVALAVGARLGAIPFHVRFSRIADVASPIDLALLLAWLAVPVGVAGLAIVDGQIAPLALPFAGDRLIIVALAFVTLVAAAIAAFIQDDLRHATGYLVIADGGLVLLGFAALDPAAWICPSTQVAELPPAAAEAPESESLVEVPPQAGRMRATALMPAARALVRVVFTYVLRC